METTISSDCAFRTQVWDITLIGATSAFVWCQLAGQTLGNILRMNYKEGPLYSVYNIVQMIGASTLNRIDWIGSTVPNLRCGKNLSKPEMCVNESDDSVLI